MEERITIEIIESKEFATENGGYSRKEVDRFLDAICDEMANLQDEIDRLNKQLAVAEARSKMAPPAQETAKAVPDSDFREILEMAQRVKSETIAAAEKQAAEIVANAQEEAKAKLGSLEEEKEALTAKVEELKLAGMELREKIASVLKAQQEALDTTAELF